jgi:hypothetical protein
MSTKHTQGPWALESETRGSYGSDLIVTAGDGGTTVAHCGGRFAFPKDGDEAEANARLITAAPDLIDALEWILPEQKVCNRCENAGQLCVGHAAIAKARGSR